MSFLPNKFCQDCGCKLDPVDTNERFDASVYGLCYKCVANRLKPNTGAFNKQTGAKRTV